MNSGNMIGVFRDVSAGGLFACVSNFLSISWTATAPVCMCALFSICSLGTVLEGGFGVFVTRHCWGLCAFRMLVSIVQQVEMLLYLSFCAFSLNLFPLRFVRHHSDVFLM